MPSRKSGLKHIRADKKKRLRNTGVISSIRTNIAKFERLIKKGEKENAKKLLRNISSAVDKAVKRQIIKNNTAARQKARLAKKLTGT